MPHDRRSDPIFVGYLPTPKKDHVFLKTFLPLLLILTAVVAAAVSTEQPNPGTGIWDTGHELKLEGQLVPGPYPILRVKDSERPGGIRTWLLAEQGKIGVQNRVTSLGITQPTDVIARGYRIERDGQGMLELISGEDALVISKNPTASLPAQARTPRKRVSVTGEIIDPKCWLGVMKPGFGKPHKACATLCIEGGIPPMFIWINESGSRTRALLLGSDGEQIVDRIRSRIADPITIEGNLETWDDLHVLKLDSGATAIRSH